MRFASIFGNEATRARLVVAAIIAYSTALTPRLHFTNFCILHIIAELIFISLSFYPRNLILSGHVSQVLKGTDQRTFNYLYNVRIHLPRPQHHAQMLIPTLFGTIFIKIRHI